MINDEERDRIAQAWGFKDAAELVGLHEAAFPGYAEARQQANAEMAEFEQRIMSRVDEINAQLSEGVSYVVKSARETEEK